MQISTSNPQSLQNRQLPFTESHLCKRSRYDELEKADAARG
jgi:hypothetical protein